jgi:hypothetical protein
VVTTNSEEILGVDIGEVLVEQNPADPTVAFSGPHYLNSPEVPDAFRVLRRLSQERFGGRIHLITRCGLKRRKKRVEWLDHHAFYARVGILREPPRYCWTPHNKSHVCHDLGVTHFIDDDPRELVHLAELIPNLILFRPKRQFPEYDKFVHDSTTQVASWSEIEKLLLP